MTARVVRAVAVQAAPVVLDLAATLARLDDWTAQAAAKHAELERHIRVIPNVVRDRLRLALKAAGKSPRPLARVIT